jgi:hypothetical protein
MEDGVARKEQADNGENLEVAGSLAGDDLAPNHKPKCPEKREINRGGSTRSDQSRARNGKPTSGPDNEQH